MTRDPINNTIVFILRLFLAESQCYVKWMFYTAFLFYIIIEVNLLFFLNNGAHNCIDLLELDIQRSLFFRDLTK